MFKRMPLFALALGVLFSAVLLGTLWFVNARIAKPKSLGVQNGRLQPCPDSPNCVSSQADLPQALVKPLSFTGPPDAVLSHLDSILASLPRARLITTRPDYRHYEFRTLLCRYVDDVELLLDRPKGQIHIRSASRLGYSDLGANRRRVESIRKLWQESSP